MIHEILPGALIKPWRNVSKYRFELPDALVGVWVSCGASFQEQFDLTSDDDCDKLVYWWLSMGRAEFPGIRDALDTYILDRFHFSSIASEFTALKQTPLMSLLYRNRSDIQESFDLNDGEGFFSFWQWWLGPGGREYLIDTDIILLKQVDILLSRISMNSDGIDYWSDRVIFEALRSLRLLPHKFLDSIVLLFEEVHYRHLRTVFNGEVINFSPSPLMMLVYRNRSDLQEAFPLVKSGESEEFWDWWFKADLTELVINEKQFRVHEALAVIAGTAPGATKAYDPFYLGALQIIGNVGVEDWTLIQPIMEKIHFQYLGTSTGVNSLTPLMGLIYRNRTDLQKAFPLNENASSAAFRRWWFTNGATEYLPAQEFFRLYEATAILLSLDDKTERLDTLLNYFEFANFFRSENPDSEELIQLVDDIHLKYVKSFREKGVLTPLLKLIYHYRSDLRNLFPDDSNATIENIYKWWDDVGHLEFGLQKACRNSNEFSRDLVILTKPAKKYPSVALTGYPRGEFGLGEDIRLLRTSLRTADIEPDVIRVPWKITAREGINEPSIESEDADFGNDVMIYVMPAFDTLTLLNKVGPHAFSARKKIGYWQWELSKFPEPAMMAFDLIDEIWCHSEHSANAFRAATDKPVKRVPLPVQPPVFEPTKRCTFKLNENNFIVFTSFDGASSISRKNPMGAILAFQKAFPQESHPNVQLVVKAMNALDDGLWRDCVRKSYLDDRIVIHNEVLERSTYYQLLACCDVVLSMHRAEGFGRLMAEAMAINIPVIATGYSGNLDFMNEENSWLVSGQQCKLVPRDYPFYQGQEWVEPNIDEAAEALRDCFINADKRIRLVQKAKETIDRYSPQSCGEVYRAMLLAKD